MTPEGEGGGADVIVLPRIASPYWTKEQRRAAWKAFDAFTRSQEPIYQSEARLRFTTEEREVRELLRQTLREEEKATKAPITPESLDEFRRRLGDRYDRYHRDWRRRYDEIMGETVRVVGGETSAQLGVAFNVLNPAFREAIDDRLNLLVGDPVNGGVPDRTFRAIIDSIGVGIEEGDGIAELEGRVLDVFGRGYYRLTEDGVVIQVMSAQQRARLIARTETTAVSNAASVAAVKASALAYLKEWLSQGDDRVRPEHLDMEGEAVEIDAEFSNGLEYPSEPNCRCTILFVRDRSKTLRFGRRLITRAAGLSRRVRSIHSARRAA